MLHPAVFDGHGYYYPIGNSPAINLVGYLPPEVDADILLLGCGDVRNILFTIFTESSETVNAVRRKYHFTCCDFEGAVIARNILLMAMVLKNEESSVMWSIYYDIFMSEGCSKALKRHLEELILASGDTDSWSKSEIGQVLKMGSRYTLATVRRLWNLWAKDLGDKTKEGQLRKYYEKELEGLVKDRHSKGAVVSLARSAGPLTLEVLSPSIKHFEHYWKHGTTDDTPKKPPVPNPTFGLSNYGQTFSVHYGTNPLAGFHLSTAVVPFESIDSSCHFRPMADSSDFTPLITCAKEEFSLWCRHFRRARDDNAWIVCFFVDEALELCGSLSQAMSDMDATGIKEINEANAVSKGYLYNHPTQFNVIDISNLIDHVGTYNILLSALSLLRKNHISYLNTETLLDHEFDPEHGTEGLYNVFGVDPASLFTLLGITPVDFICGQTSISQVSEHMLEGLTKGAGAQRHSRLVWKWLPLFRPDGINKNCVSTSQRPKFTYDTDAMINFLAAVYKKLFAIENHLWAMQQLRRSIQSTGPINMLQHNTRATYSLFLQKIKHVTSETVDWDGLMEKLDLVVTHECGSFIASCFLQEQNVLNHLHSVNTANYLTEHPGIAALKYSGGIGTDFDRLEEYDAVTCVTLSVPIKAFRRLAMRDMKQIGSPPLHLTLSCGSMMNHFGNLHRRFGKLDVIAAPSGVSIQKDAPTFTEDHDGWTGNSDLLYSCMVPTWFLLLDGCKVSLDIVSSPATALLTQEFGHFMKLFESNVRDHEKVRLSTKLPMANPGNTSLSDGRQRVSSVPKHNESEREPATQPSGLHSDYQLKILAGVRPKISHILHRWSVESDNSLVKLLEDKAAISTTRLGTSAIRIHLGPKSKLVAFPFPVGESTKLLIARKPKYIEIDAPLYNDNGGPVYLHFPVGIADKSLRSITPWSLHRINLDKSPPVLIDLAKHNKTKYEWINSVATFAFSKQERANVNSTSTKFFGDIMAEIKETIHMILVRYLGIQGFKHSTFVLSCIGVGGYMLIYVKDIRLDLSGQSIIADCALVPFEDNTLHKLAPLLVSLHHAPVRNSPEETKAWLQLSVSLVERCRTWQHKADCEYLRSESVPLSAPDLKIGACPICSCGKGIFPKAFHDDPAIKAFLPYATRAAIGPLFPPPYSKELQNMAELISMSQNLSLSGSIRPPPPEKRVCAVCGKGANGDRQLKKCSACMKVEYCSKECQKKDWKSHKKTHRS
ncbi:hypothetical protein TWF281_001234 [Arthrobotrys megalospora]